MTSCKFDPGIYHFVSSSAKYCDSSTSLVKSLLPNSGSYISESWSFKLSWRSSLHGSTSLKFMQVRKSAFELEVTINLESSLCCGDEMLKDSSSSLDKHSGCNSLHGAAGVEVDNLMDVIDDGGAHGLAGGGGGDGTNNNGWRWVK